ncbi:unnamed protein product [Rotaria sp. Silwood1]|nr:unnamed protein product [Rotaria sp. Silwood1]
MKRLARANSFLSNSSSHFDHNWTTVTRTTLLSLLSHSPMPSVDIPFQTTHLPQPAYTDDGGSILVRAYVEQEQRYT